MPTAHPSCPRPTGLQFPLAARWVAVLLALAPLLLAARQGEDPPPASAKKLGILLFPGVQVIDFAGPYEVLSGATSKGQKLFEVTTVGLTTEVFRAGSIEKGIRMMADVSIQDCPKLDILVIPGGEVGSIEDSPEAMAWIDKTIAGAECVMSVCNGAFVLAKGGHLKNQSATTFHYFIDDLAQAEPTCTPVYDQRFVDNGRIVTAAGLSSGIDGALHLVERYGSRYDAEQLALGLEYNWQPELNWSRANLADRHYIAMVGDGFPFLEGSVTEWTAVENSGTVDRWTKRWTFGSALGRKELLEVVESKLSASWTKASAAAGTTTWSFDDEKGNPWTAIHQLDSTGANAWTMAIRIERDR
jgi:putative intracellular protease/amidase